MEHSGDDAGAGFDASLRSVVGNYSALDCFSRNSFQKQPKTAAAKNGFAFAIEDIIVRLSQGQNIAQKIRFADCPVFPNRFAGKQHRNFTEGGNRWQRNETHGPTNARAVSGQLFSQSKQSGSDKDRAKKVSRQIRFRQRPERFD